MSKIASLAKAGVTLAIDPSGASAGVVLAQDAIDKIAGWLVREDRGRYDEIMKRVRESLEGLVAGGEVNSQYVEPAVTTAEVLLTQHGLDSTPLTALNLEASKAANAVFERGAGVLRWLGEGEEALCRRMVRAFYKALLDDPEAIPEMEGAFRRAVLSRLSEIETLTGEIAEAVRAMAGGALLVSPSRVWLPDRFPPSALLRADYQAVPFHGRDELCAEIEAWCESDAPVGVRVYTGAGGMGKTRLFIELCRRMGRNQWRTGFLDREAANAPSWLMDRLVGDAKNVFIVVDTSVRLKIE